MKTFTCLVMMAAATAVAANPLLRNADFSAGKDGWSLELHNSAKATWDVAGNRGSAPSSVPADGNALCVSMSTVEAKPWDYQLIQSGIALKPDTSYVLSFWANSTKGQDIGLSIGEGQAPWNTAGLKQSAGLAPGWNYYSYTFKTNALAANNPRLVVNLGYDVGKLWITDFKLSPESEPGVNLLRDGKFVREQEEWSTRGTHHPGFSVSYQSVKSLLSGSSTPAVTADQPIAAIRITTPGKSTLDVSLKQKAIALKPGKRYRLTFRACSSQPRELRVLAQQDHSPWSWAGLRGSAELGESWETYRYEFVATEAANEPLQLKLAMGVPNGNIWISDLSLEQI